MRVMEQRIRNGGHLSVLLLAITFQLILVLKVDQLTLLEVGMLHRKELIGLMAIIGQNIEIKT